MPNQFESPQPSSSEETLRETFLLDFASRLGPGVSPFARHETVSEVRAHLNASAAAYEEMGLDPEAAMRAAIQKFGDVPRIAKGLRKEERKHRRFSATGLAVVAFGGLVGAVGISFCEMVYVRLHLVANQDPFTTLIGFLFTSPLAWIVCRRSLSVLQAAKLGAWFLPLAILGFACVLNRSIPLRDGGALFLTMASTLAVTGAVAGAASAWWAQRISSRNRLTTA